MLEVNKKLEKNKEQNGLHQLKSKSLLYLKIIVNNELDH